MLRMKVSQLEKSTLRRRKCVNVFGRFAKRKRWERWRANRQLVSGSVQAPGTILRRSRPITPTPRKIVETVYAKSCNLVDFLGRKWLAMPSIMHARLIRLRSLTLTILELRFNAFPPRNNPWQTQRGCLTKYKLKIKC